MRSKQRKIQRKNSYGLKTTKKAFATRRNCFINPPFLAYPDFSKEFILFTDDCNYGVGAILSQKQEQGKVVIAYASKQFKDSELKFSTVEKEAYAVVFAIKLFGPTYALNRFLRFTWGVNTKNILN